jgi:uncharacterized membrane protein
MSDAIKMPDAKDAADNKVVAMIGYLGILCLLPLLLKKDSAFAQFHGKQGLVLCLAWIVVMLVGWFPFIGWVLWIATVVLTVVGMMNAYNGKMELLPLIGQYADKIKL